MVDSHIRLGHLEDAEKYCKVAEKIAPNHPYTFVRRGQLSYAQEKYEEALKLYQQANSLHSDPTEFNLDLALPLFCLGRSDEALATIHKRLKVHPHFSDLDVIIPEYEKLQQRFPDLPDLAKALELLRAARRISD